jgi:hypothetical protein
MISCYQVMSCYHAVIKLWAEALWSDCDQIVIRPLSGCDLATIKDWDDLWLGCDQAVIRDCDQAVIRSTYSSSMPSILPWSQVMLFLYYWVVKTHFRIWWLCGYFVTKNFIIVCCGVWTHDQKCVPLGIWTHDHFKISFPWTLKPLNPVKCQNEKKAAPPEMAGAPLPTCSGGKAIHDPQ